MLLRLGELGGDCLVEPVQLLHRGEGGVNRLGEALLLRRAQLQVLGELLEMSLGVLGMRIFGLFMLKSAVVMGPAM